jgi:type II secretory pathway pseudopilin PulG
MARLSRISRNAGVSLVELLLAIAIAGLVLPAIVSGFISSRQGLVQQSQRERAVSYFREAQEAVRSVREAGWTAFAVNGTYHPYVQSGAWKLGSGSETIGEYTRSVIISNVSRDSAGAIVTTGGTNDPSTKKVTITVGWDVPYSSSLSSTLYLTRYLNNLSFIQTTTADFAANTLVQTATASVGDGAAQLGNNLKAKWCSPSFASTSIDLPDGPPVAVSATASAVSSAIANDIFTVTSPYATSSTKLAYVQVPANIDPPTASLKGTFTLDATKYSSAGLVPTGIGLDNDFVTNTVKYYRSSGGKLYALIGTTKPDKEVIAIQINDGTGDAWQDSVNHIYKYWTFFNTRMYQGNSTSTPNQDQSPYGYGVVSLSILGTRAYAISGGYLYVIDLSNIDSKSTSVGLDMVGCRIELDGTDCNPTTSKVRKYPAGSTGVSWSAESAGQTGCMDGGAIQKYADNDIFPIKVGANTYVYIAVGAGADPELNIVNVTTVPTSSTTPKITQSTCGTIASGNASWKRISSLDFNSKSGTQESSNSVYGNTSGTRAYIASNGGVDGNSDGSPDSDQFYVVDTTNKSTPKFLSGTAATGATSGYYNGDTTNIQMFPTRSLTVLNGQRVVLVGKDGFPADGTEPKEYQVLNLDTEASPTYCGGLNFLSGFNDLTSVTEADFDTFVYMVANTNEKQLKIIQGGPDGTYSNTGTMESTALDAGFDTTFNRYSATETLPTNTTLKFQFAGADAVSGSCTGASYSYTGPDGSGATYYTATTSAIFVGTSGSYKNPARCFRYKAYFDTTDYNATPVLSDMTINYSP